MERVIGEIRLAEGGGGEGKKGLNGVKENGVNGAASAAKEGELLVPQRVINEGLKAVMAQLEPLLGIEGDN